MKDVVYIVVDINGCDRMRKTLPPLRRGEIAIKVSVNVDDKHFQPTVVTGEINIKDVEQLPDIDLTVREALRNKGIDVHYKYDKELFITGDKKEEKKIE